MNAFQPTASDSAGARNIPFATKPMGYDPDQVNQYLQKLMGEYRNLQQNYAQLLQKHNDLEKQSGVNMDAIAKAMVEAEAHAIRIVAKAKEEASQIVQDAKLNLIVLKNEKSQVISEISGIADRLKAIDLNIPNHLLA